MLDTRMCLPNLVLNIFVGLLDGLHLVLRQDVHEVALSTPLRLRLHHPDLQIIIGVLRNLDNRLHQSLHRQVVGMLVIHLSRLLLLEGRLLLNEFIKHPHRGLNSVLLVSSTR